MQLGLIVRSDYALAQHFAPHESMPRCCVDEAAILIATSEELRDHQVVHLETPAGGSARARTAHGHEPLLPARRQSGRRLTYTLCVVTEGVVERGEFTDAPVDE